MKFALPIVLLMGLATHISFGDQRDTYVLSQHNGHEISLYGMTRPGAPTRLLLHGSSEVAFEIDTYIVYEDPDGGRPIVLGLSRGPDRRIWRLDNEGFHFTDQMAQLLTRISDRQALVVPPHSNQIELVDFPSLKRIQTIRKQGWFGNSDLRLIAPAREGKSFIAVNLEGYLSLANVTDGLDPLLFGNAEPPEALSDRHEALLNLRFMFPTFVVDHCLSGKWGFWLLGRRSGSDAYFALYLTYHRDGRELPLLNLGNEPGTALGTRISLGNDALLTTKAHRSIVIPRFGRHGFVDSEDLPTIKANPERGPRGAPDQLRYSFGADYISTMEPDGPVALASKQLQSPHLMLPDSVDIAHDIHNVTGYAMWIPLNPLLRYLSVRPLLNYRLQTLDLEELAEVNITRRGGAIYYASEEYDFPVFRLAELLAWNSRRACGPRLKRAGDGNGFRDNVGGRNRLFVKQYP